MTVQARCRPSAGLTVLGNHNRIDIEYTLRAVACRIARMVISAQAMPFLVWGHGPVIILDHSNAEGISLQAAH